jgi:uncharacterized membrane protein HdeD (DUF308 family)
MFYILPLFLGVALLIAGGAIMSYSNAFNKEMWKGIVLIIIGFNAIECGIFLFFIE